MKYLNFRPDTLNMTEQNVRNRFELTGTGKDLLKRTSATQELISTFKKWVLMKLSSFCIPKCTSVRQNQATQLERNFRDYIYDNKVSI